MTERLSTAVLPPPTLPVLLAENAGLAFLGERIWPAARLTPSRAQTFAAARNLTGRSNTDVLRTMAKSARGQVIEETYVDFPLHYTEQEASLYRRPYAHLRANGGRSTGQWWLKDTANLELRTAVARLERCLIASLPAATPDWRWLESHLLPSADFLVVARDDDFSHGILASAGFKLWWRTFAAKLTPVDRVRTFPFPWPPATLLSAHTRTQHEHRVAIAQAARAGDEDQLNTAVAAAYGWPADLTQEELLSYMSSLNRQRS